MTASKSLPARPSLESLRKQAKKLARETEVSQRQAQLVLARQYGFAGWRDLVAEVNKRLGTGLEWAARQARRIIHDNDVDGLTQLVAEHPALLSWHGDEARDGILGLATGSFGDSFDPISEQHFTRAACAELLIDAGAIVMPAVTQGMLDARTRGLLQLFQRKGLLPRTLPFLAALGDLDGVRAALDEPGPGPGHDRAALTDAFLRATSYKHEAIASLLLERLIGRDPALGQQVDGGVGRAAFVTYFIEHRQGGLEHAPEDGPWPIYLMSEIKHAARDGDVTACAEILDREPWLLGDAHVDFQQRIIEQATLQDREGIIVALLDGDPAILRRQPPPESQAMEIAFTYAHTHLVPLLTRIWPVPDDLPYNAGRGNLSRVKTWFDASGAPALGDLDDHYPANNPRARGHLNWNPPTAQQVLDVALAWSVINRHFEVADFLLAHGADINTNWSSHEPASILHDLVFQGNYESMQFVIDRGIDMTIHDYRWNATAAGWARYAAHDEKMAQWLEEASRIRGGGSR